MTKMSKLLNRKHNSGTSKTGSAPLAVLDAADLRKFKEQRRIMSDQGRLLTMLQVCYNSFLIDIQAKYKVPEDISVNLQTGDIHKAIVEHPDV